MHVPVQPGILESVPGLREALDLSGHGVQVPSTPAQLGWWLRGDNLGDLLHLTRRVEKSLAPAVGLHHVVDAMRAGRLDLRELGL